MYKTGCEYDSLLRGPMTLTLIAERWQWIRHYLFLYDLGLSRLGFEHSIFRLPDERSNPLRHPRSLISVIITINYANICY